MRSQILLIALTQLALASTLSAAEAVYQAEDQIWNDGIFSTQHTGYVGTGYVDMTNIPGPYIDVIVTVPAAGTYQLNMRFANGADISRPMNLAINGMAHASAWSFAPTGAWTSWTKQSNPVPLKAGSNVLRFTSAAAAGAPNLDSLHIGAKLLNEAELQSWSEGVLETIHTGFSGSAYVNGANKAGSWLEWKILAPVAGSYNLKIRYANGTAVNRQMDMVINGEFKLPVWDFVGTGAWTNWKEINKNISLEEGINTFRLVALFDDGGPNLDLLTIK